MDARCIRMTAIPRWHGRSWTGVLVILVVMLVSPCRAESPTLSEAIIALDGWRASFVNVWFIFEVDLARSVDAAGKLGPQTVARNEYYWSESDKFLWDQQQLVAGKQTRHSTFFSDGRQTGRAFYPDNSEHLDALPTMIDVGQRDLSGKSGVKGMLVVPLFGIWDAAECEWFPQLLNGRGENQRVVSVEGTECVEVSYRRGTDPKSLSDTVVLDPTHGYLPLRVVSGSWRAETNSFKWIPPGIWMPSTGFLETQSGRQLWRVLEVKCNEDLPAVKVQMPQPGNGTRVVDRDRHTQSFHGQSGAPPVADPIPKKVNPDHGLKTSPVVARPHSGNWPSASVWFFGLGVAALLASLAVYHKLRS